jgi:sec-independent protein translocase protein TatC
MFEDLRPHLVELRKRLGLSVLSVFVMFIVTFTFHEQILAWVTQPLNDALAQVGRVIESQGMTQWKIQEADQNDTKAEATTSNDAQKRPEAYIQKASGATERLHETLTQASIVAGEQNNSKLALLLKDAADSAKESAIATAKLATLLDRGEQSENNTSKKNFGGMVTTQQVGGVFFVALKVSFFAALLGALPFILYQLWLFISPGLYANEKKMILPFVVGGTFMFMVGVLFAYYIVTPFGFQFLITFGSFLYTPLINIEDYVGFFTKIMMGFGLAFELPVFAYFLALLGLVTDKTLKDFFKYAIIIIFLVAALLTPPDVLTQLLMALPLVILYGVSILIVGIVNPYKEDDEEDEETPETQKDQ